MVLSKASCRPCARITGSVEQYCLRTMFGPLRMRLGLPTRRPKERPDHLNVQFERPGNLVETRSIPVKDYPKVLHLLKLSPPTILQGKSSENIIKCVAWAYTDESLSQQVVKYHAQKLLVADYDPSVFCRMLAKIAHSYAVSIMGLDGFEGYLPNLIMGQQGYIPDLVGGYLDDFPPEDDGPIHHVQLQFLVGPFGPFLAVSIRLFSFLGAPKYLVVVGRPTESGKKFWASVEETIDYEPIKFTFPY
jgi:hypothetical protein